MRAIGSATTFGLFIGTAGQGEFSDRFGRRFIYQFNLLLFGIFTILGAFAPERHAADRSAASSPASGSAPSNRSPSPMPANIHPKRIRGRILAIVHFIGGACVWPIGTAVVLLLGSLPTTPESAGAACGSCFGIGALIVWVFRFTLPESPRYLATHGRGKEALDVLGKLGIAGPTKPLSTDAASDTKSDPFSVVFTHVPGPRRRRHDLLHGVLRRRHRARRLAAEHHERQGLLHHQVAAIHAGHELRGAVRQHLHDVRARQIRPQDHLGLRFHRRRH